MSRPDFTKTWASSRPSIPAISGPDYALGFASYLGAIPPSTDDHDYIMNLQDQRAVWLGQQMLLTVGHEWQSDIAYNLYAVVRSPVNGKLYRSLVASNTGNEPSVSASQWILEESLTQGGIIKITTVGVTSWSVPLAMQLGIIKPKVTVVAGGGGGGGASSATGAAGGGGGGGSSGFRYVDLTGVTSVSVTVGSGGAAGIGIATAPTAGGSSSFGAHISCSGGGAGVNSNGGSTIAGNGGVTVTGADVATLGGSGRYSLVSNGVFAAAGVGGDSQLGKGATAPNVTGTAIAQQVGIAGQNGAGGSGGSAYNATANGGAGGSGLVIIEW